MVAPGGLWTMTSAGTQDKRLPKGKGDTLAPTWSADGKHIAFVDLAAKHGSNYAIYVIGANQYGEQPCDTKGVGCGNGVSNGREVLYSNTAGDPDAANGMRTFTDLSYDAQDTAAPWCAYEPYGLPFCRRAPTW